MTAAALWAAVVVSYDADGLISLTNINDNAATAIDTTIGEDAAQDVIDYWPIYAQEEYDSTDSTHVAVGKMAVIAVLWRRGGTSTTIEQVKWDEIFSSDGMIAKVRRTGPRARQKPKSNSGVSQRSELSNGRRVRDWADPDALPLGRTYLPRRVISDD